MAIGKKDFCSFIYQFLVIIDVPLNLPELFICNDTLQSFTGILWNMLCYEIIHITSQCLLLAWGTYPRNLLVVTEHETRWGFWVLWLCSGRANVLWELCKAVRWGETEGLGLPGKGSGPGLCPWLGCAGAGTAVAVAIVCHEWLLHANHSAVAIFNPKFWHVGFRTVLVLNVKETTEQGTKGLFWKCLEGKPHRLESCPDKTQL